jgi:hypothetical protein
VEEIRAWDHKWSGGPTKDKEAKLVFAPGYSHNLLNIPSSFQMKYIVDFFSTKEWWKLAPNDDLVDKGRCLSELGRQYVVWLNGGRSVKIDLSEGLGC